MIKQKYQKELKRIVGRLKTYNPEKVILFGSAAQGKITEDSDIDLMIIKKTRKDFFDRLTEVNRILDHRFPMDILVYTPKEIKDCLSIEDFFVEDIFKEGKILYEKK